MPTAETNGSIETAPATPEKPVRTVHVALYDGWADWEIGHLMARVNNPVWHRNPGSFQIRTVGDTLAPVTSMGGLRSTPDIVAADLSADDSAMLVLPGSGVWERHGIPWAEALVKQFIAAEVPVAAICGATFEMAAAGLLDHRRHTSAAPQYLAASGYDGGALYQNEDVVVDQGLITAGPVDGLPFARAALEVLDVYTPEVLEAWYRVFTEHDQAAYGVLASVEASA
jgi:putative intracellular protease/amidase